MSGQGFESDKVSWKPVRSFWGAAGWAGAGDESAGGGVSSEGGGCGGVEEECVAKGI